MQIKGVVSIGEEIHLTCCNSVVDLNLSGISLHEQLKDMFNQQEEDYLCDYEGVMKPPKYSMRYVILDKEPLSETSFDSLVSEVVMNMLYSDYVSGCYSEWTCGYGGFDFVINDDGHSIFKELKGSVGKYVCIELKVVNLKDNGSNLSSLI